MEKKNNFMSTIQYNSFESFVHQNANRIFRYWVYRRLYTPYEQSQKFSDESMFEDDMCACAYIRECISLGNGEYMLGFEDALDVNCPEDDYSQHLKYYKLSEIRLEYYEGDSEELPY